MEKKPLIIGVSHHNTYGLVRCFGESGIKVDLILYDCSDSYIGYSKYVNDLWYNDTAEKAVEQAYELVNNKPSYYVILSSTDTVASLVDIRYEEFKDKCSFFNCGAIGKLTHFMDKEIQTIAAKRVGFAIPKTVSFNKGESTIMFDSFPCIIKPLASIDGGKRLLFCNSQNEIDRHIADFSDIEKILLQEYLVKDEEIVLLGVSYRGNIVIPGYIIKYRDVMGGTTYSCTAPSNHLDVSLLEKAKSFVCSLNYEGLFGIELIKSKENYYFIEINLRNDATTYSLAVAGVNLPLMYYNLCSGTNSIDETIFEVRTIFSIVEIVDFSNVVHRRIHFLEWFKQLRQAECRYYFSKEDKSPYQLAKKNYILTILKKLIRR